MRVWIDACDLLDCHGKQVSFLDAHPYSYDESVTLPAIAYLRGENVDLRVMSAKEAESLIALLVQVRDWFVARDARASWQQLPVAEDDQSGLAHDLADVWGPA